MYWVEQMSGRRNVSWKNVGPNKCLSTCGLYYKHITIVNDESIMKLQVVSSPTNVILMTLEVSFMLLANIYI
jgi:hypothetical protein